MINVYRPRIPFDPNHPKSTISILEQVAPSDGADDQRQSMNPSEIARRGSVTLKLKDSRFDSAQLQDYIDDPIGCMFSHAVQRTVATPTWNEDDMRNSVLSFVNDAKNHFYPQCEGYMITLDSIQITGCKSVKDGSAGVQLCVMEILGNAIFLELKKWNAYRGNILELAEDYVRVGLCNDVYYAKVFKIDTSVPGHKETNDSLRVGQEIRFVCSNVKDSEPPFLMHGHLLDILTS